MREGKMLMPCASEKANFSRKIFKKYDDLLENLIGEIRVESVVD